MSASLVSIVIPSYNYAKYLSEAIDSALSQTYKRIEVLVIDDGSTDGTAEVAATYAKRIKYFYKSNGGISSARNYGADHIIGEYVVFLDADDVLDKCYVAKTLALLQAQSDQVGYVYTQLRLFEASDEITQYPGFRKNYLMVSNFVAATSLIRAELVKKYAYDTRLTYLEDWDFYLTLCEHDIRGVLLSEPLLYYRKHNDSSSTLDILTQSKRISNYCRVRVKHRRLYGLAQTLVYLAWYVARKFNLVSGTNP